MLKEILTSVVVPIICMQAFAADLFPDGNLRDIKAGEYIQTTDLVGGYPIIQNDGNWKFTGGKAYTSSGGADTVKLGTVQLDYVHAGYLLARQSISANTGSGGASSWSGTPCAAGHLVIRDKGRGRQDNCLTIDAQSVNVGTTSITLLNVVLTNTGTGGRYYRIVFSINADLLGTRGTGTGDWTEAELKAKPHRKEAVDRLTVWAEQIQDGSIKAFDFSKPQDVYTKVPSFMTLLPVPEDLVGQKRSISFLSAVEHLRHVESIKSIAYARYEDYRGAWGFVTEQPSQEVADLAAVAKCESIRSVNRPDVPPCTLYRIIDGKRLSDNFEFKRVTSQ